MRTGERCVLTQITEKTRIIENTHKLGCEFSIFTFEKICEQVSAEGGKTGIPEVFSWQYRSLWVFNNTAWCSLI